ncbi:MAG: hypothetical protein V4722_18325 [Bacteroidota bacterium]
MVKIIAIAVLMFFTGSFSYGAPADTTIKDVKIVFTYTKNIFPREWQEGAINGKGEEILPTEITRTKEIMIAALNKYPTEVFKADLNTVYFLKQLSFYDVGYGGTNSTANLYLTSNGITNGYTDKYVEQTFHHEFSSILLRKHMSLLDTFAWNACASKGFGYNDPLDGVGAIKNNEASQEIDTQLCKEGVLTQYAHSGMENDVNTFAQNLFKPDERFWYAVEAFPLIRKKAKLLIDFYQKLNPMFTENYFRKFSTP